MIDQENESLFGDKSSPQLVLFHWRPIDNLKRSLERISYFKAEEKLEALRPEPLSGKKSTSAPEKN